MILIEEDGEVCLYGDDGLGSDLIDVDLIVVFLIFKGVLKSLVEVNDE